MKNFYDILGVDKNIPTSEIKKAYNKLLRKYPPEKEAEKYKEIREAYDTLKDEKSRKNYDTYFSYGDKIKKLEENAKKNIESKNYNQAEKDLKKILIIAEGTLHIREMLGEVLLLQKKYSESLIQFGKLIDENPENSDYYIKIGNIYEGKNQSYEAEKMYLKAYELDYSNSLAINSIVYFYIKQNNIDKAIKFLEKEIYRDNSLDFDDFFALTQLIECYVQKNDKIGVQKVIKDIRKVIPLDEDSKKYASWKLAKLGYQILEIQLYDLASEVLKFSADLDSENPDIKQILKLSTLYSMTSKLLDEDSIYGPIKGPILFYIHGTEENQQQRKENLELIEMILKSTNLDILEQTKTSIEKIKSKYYLLYLEQKDLYNAIETDLNIQILYVKQLRAMINDYSFSVTFKLCICALEDKDNEEFQNGIKRLNRESSIKIKNSINLIQSSYPKVYEKFFPFFNNLRTMLNESSSYSPSNSNSKSGCYIATAVYGSYEAKEVLVLRKFRDEVLQKTGIGRSFIKLYYYYSPSLATKLKKSSLITIVIKKILDKVVKYLEVKL